MVCILSVRKMHYFGLMALAAVGAFLKYPSAPQFQTWVLFQKSCRMALYVDKTLVPLGSKIALPRVPILHWTQLTTQGSVCIPFVSLGFDCVVFH